LKIAFAGTPHFARVALAALCAAGYDIALVMTQPDRPAGRGRTLQPGPVKRFALEHGLPLIQPPSLRCDGRYPEEAARAHEKLREVAPEVMVVAAYGLILPQSILDVPRQGCLNIHASLLPRWRGAAPIHRALAAGDAQTGITIMRMDAGLDTGPMLLKGVTPISVDDSLSSLHDRLASLGGEQIVEALSLLAAGGLTATPQPEQGVTYAAKVVREDSLLDFNESAEVLARRVRAFGGLARLISEAPASLMGGQVDLRIHEARAEPLVFGGHPGEIVELQRDSVLVATGQGALRLLAVQRPGGKRMAVRDFLAGFTLQPGMRFERLPA